MRITFHARRQEQGRRPSHHGGIQSQLKCDDGQWTEGSEAHMQSHFTGCPRRQLASGLSNDLIKPRKINWAIDSFAG